METIDTLCCDVAILRLSADWGILPHEQSFEVVVGGYLFGVSRGSMRFQKGVIALINYV